MKRTLLAGCSAAALVFSFGVASAGSVEFGKVDANADKNLTIEEFPQVLTEQVSIRSSTPMAMATSTKLSSVPERT
jgi:hypothetical protein